MRLPLWRLTTLRRSIFEMLGNDRFSRPSFGEIQAKLDQYFDGPGFFIEAGAVDGFFESNTYYLEKFRGWKGILVEPVPEMYKRLAINRPGAYAFNCALVSPEFSGTTVPIAAAHAISRITLPGLGSGNNHDTSGPVIDVPARTLTSILDEVAPRQIDLFSLDVEGFEIEALKGLDFSKHKPRYMLIECLNDEVKAEMDAFLEAHYTCVDNLSFRDFLYKAKED